MNYIQTANCKINPDTCRALDKYYFKAGTDATNAVYTDKYRISKFYLWRGELLDLVHKYNPLLNNSIYTKGLHYLFTLAQQIMIDEGNRNAEERGGQIHNARTQLKNFENEVK